MFYKSNISIVARQGKFVCLRVNIVEHPSRCYAAQTTVGQCMMGFKTFHSAAATLAGIEIAHMIRKGQFIENSLSAFKQFAEFAG